MLPRFDDERDITTNDRLKIGFDNLRETWTHLPASYTSDTLTIAGHPVMERWEDSYMRELARIACSQGGRVLEVGFGMGISARYIQQYPILEHVIIEANNEVAEQGLKFGAHAKQPVTVLKGFWEKVTPTLPAESFDGILFDTYPLTAEEIHQNHFWFFNEAFRLLKPGGVLTYYSDEIGQFSPGHLEALKNAGFTDIEGVICPVNPPPGCKYWTSRTILAPIITKPITNTRDYGLHMTLDAYGANPRKLEDVNLLYETLNDLPAKIGMRKIGFPHIAQFKEKEIAGISGIIMIVESHMSIHTYSKKDFLSMDVYSCKDFDYQSVVDHIKRIYEFKDCEINVIARGKRFPKHNLHD